MTAPAPTCAYCGGAAEGNYAVHRDGLDVGPEVDLCDACGSDATPTLAEIWERIAQPSADEWAFKRAEVLP